MRCSLSLPQPTLNSPMKQDGALSAAWYFHGRNRDLGSRVFRFVHRLLYVRNKVIRTGGGLFSTMHGGSNTESNLSGKGCRARPSELGNGVTKNRPHCLRVRGAYFLNIRRYDLKIMELCRVFHAWLPWELT
jgi:hypothetical protein